MLSLLRSMYDYYFREQSNRRLRSNILSVSVLDLYIIFFLFLFCFSLHFLSSTLIFLLPVGNPGEKKKTDKKVEAAWYHRLGRHDQDVEDEVAHAFALFLVTFLLSSAIFILLTALTCNFVKDVVHSHMYTSSSRTKWKTQS